MYLAGRILMTAAFGFLALPVAASAQSAAPAKLAVGTWTGTIITPGNQEADNITYEVEYQADTLAITLVAGDHGKFALNEIKLADSKLSFSFVPGPKVVCALNWKDTAYIGECKDDDGAIVPLTMTPPAKPAKS